MSWATAVIIAMMLLALAGNVRLLAVMNRNIRLLHGRVSALEKKGSVDDQG